MAALPAAQPRGRQGAETTAAPGHAEHTSQWLQHRVSLGLAQLQIWGVFKEGRKEALLIEGKHTAKRQQQRTALLQGLLPTFPLCSSSERPYLLTDRQGMGKPRALLGH